MRNFPRAEISAPLYVPLQAYARQTGTSVDVLGFKFTIMEMPAEEIDKSPEAGVYVYGLFMDSCLWNKEKWVIEDSLPGVPYAQLPVVCSCIDYTCPYLVAAPLPPLPRAGSYVPCITLPLVPPPPPLSWATKQQPAPILSLLLVPLHRTAAYYPRDVLAGDGRLGGRGLHHRDM